MIYTTKPIIRTQPVIFNGPTIIEGTETISENIHKRIETTPSITRPPGPIIIN